MRTAPLRVLAVAGAIGVLTSAGTCGNGRIGERERSVEADSALAAAPGLLDGGQGAGSGVFDGGRIVPDRLLVTSGRIRRLFGGRLRVDTGQLRASIAGSTSRNVAMRFTFAGASVDERPLASGKLVRQVGVRLRYQDTCNVVNVMWRLAPATGILVAVKHNPGERLHAQCGVDGYRYPAPARSAPVPVIASGEEHLLRAALDGTELRVWVDDRLVWEGSLGPEVLTFDGPPGVRSDNAAFEFELFD